MSGTVAGGKLAAKKNMEKYGKDFYKNIGAEGGKTRNPSKGFGSNRELAREAGAKGGTISRRGPSPLDKVTLKYEQAPKPKKRLTKTTRWPSVFSWNRGE